MAARERSCNPGIDRRLKEHLGLCADDSEGLKKKRGVDFRHIGARYTGPRLHNELADRRVDPCWGWHTRYVEHAEGGYCVDCDFPLKNAGEEDVANWPMPSPDDYDYSELADQCKTNEEQGLHIGNPELACVMNTAGFFRGMEQHFLDLALNDPAGLLLIDRFLAIQLKTTERALNEVGP